MRRGYKPRRCMYTVLSAVVGSTALAPYCVYANTSAANFQMREQVVDLVGIMSVTDATAQVSRADFAEMLVKASSWRENLTSTAVSVFADVPASHPSAIYIRIAASQGWMTGFLGGLFKPDDYITYKDAVKAILALLGYTDDDFTGDLASSRISQFNYLELNEEVTNRQADGLHEYFL